MKCSNCGAPIREGQIFCEKCGQEIQWVPDYDTFGTYMEQERIKKEQKEKAEAEAARMRAAAIAEEKKKKKKKRKMAACVSGLVLLGIIVFSVAMKIRTNTQNYNDFDYQMQMADVSFSNQKYEESYEFVQRAITLDGENIDAQILRAQILVNLKKEDQAIGLLEEMIDKYPDESVVYGQLIKLYSAKEENDKIKALLDSCDNDEIREKYAGYISEPPVFSLPGGSYNDEKTLELYSKDQNTKIYYTLDGSVPTEDSTLYTGSIELKDGTTTVNAIAVNGKGISSDVVSNDYDITLLPPETPRISPSSGTFTTDMDTSIYVIVPDGCKAYYAFDEKPTKNSKLYIEGEPVAMPEGTHTFYAILENERGQLSYPGSALYTLKEPE